MFNKDEKYLNKTFGKGNHFSVPDGYFEDANARIMQRVGGIGVKGSQSVATGSATTVTLWSRYRKAIIGVAASVCVGMFSLGTYMHIGNIAQNKQVASQHSKELHDNAYSSFDALVDYSMIDTDDMYAYMADAQ